MSQVQFLKTSFFFILFLFATGMLSSDSFAEEIVVPVYPNAGMTPDAAYRQLVAGNARYLKDASEAARTLPRLPSDETKFPIATIVYSLDMPVRPTVLTQTSDHDVYLAGVEAGVVSIDDMATIEYGLINLQTPLLVVMGHYPSRTVSTLIRKYDELEAQAQAEIAKVKSEETPIVGSTPSAMKLYNLVGPSIARSREAYPDLQGYDLANVVSEALVWQSLETILMKSTVAQDLIKSGRINVIAAIVDDKTGKIYWLGSHPLQDEFLKPVPDNLRAEDGQTDILAETDLTEPLDDATIQEYVTKYENDPYYEDVVTEYYAQPVYYQPSWELFSRRAWVYRPWYGVWYDPFVPWPYWSPWGAPVETPGLGVSFWEGRLNFFIGFNRHFGPPLYYDPLFRPNDPWWGTDYFANIGRRRHDAVFDSILGGRRDEVPLGSREVGGLRPPRSYRPGIARPGLVIGLGGANVGIDEARRRSALFPGATPPESQHSGTLVPRNMGKIFQRNELRNDRTRLPSFSSPENVDSRRDNLPPHSANQLNNSEGMRGRSVAPSSGSSPGKNHGSPSASSSDVRPGAPDRRGANYPPKFYFQTVERRNEGNSNLQIQNTPTQRDSSGLFASRDHHLPAQGGAASRTVNGDPHTLGISRFAANRSPESSTRRGGVAPRPASLEGTSARNSAQFLPAGAKTQPQSVVPPHR